MRSSRASPDTRSLHHRSKRQALSFKPQAPRSTRHLTPSPSRLLQQRPWFGPPSSCHSSFLPLAPHLVLELPPLPQDMAASSSLASSPPLPQPSATSGPRSPAHSQRPSSCSGRRTLFCVQGRGRWGHPWPACLLPMAPFQGREWCGGSSGANLQGQNVAGGMPEQ